MTRHTLRAALALTLGLALAAPGQAGEAADLVFADRAPWDVGANGLVWHLTRELPAVPDLTPSGEGTVTLSAGTDPSDGKPTVQLQEETPSRSRRIGPFPTSGGDPVVLYFLESTSRDMAALTGGSPYYIRNRIKDALFRGGEVRRANGVTTVEFAPFANDPNAARMWGFDTLSMRLVMGDDPRQPIRELVAETAGPVRPPTPPGAPAIAPAPYRQRLVQQ